MTSILGVDVGGTFTDFLLWQDGELSVYKRPSTPDDPSRGVLAGLDEAGISPDEVVHGSTVVTNTVLERKGAKTALITTKGFRDVLAIGRQTRPKLYDLEPSRPPPLIPDALRFELDERLDHHGDVLKKLSRRSVEVLLDKIEQLGVDSLAVCFLFSFLNPAHERLVRDAARERGIACCASFEVLPEYREYERTSTTAINAYVAPVVERYMSRLSTGLGARKAGTLRVMQSNGGSARADIAASVAVRTVLSGPAGGVAGAFHVAKAAGFDRIITLDMGGTSTDVCLCDGSVPFTSESTIDGMPLRIPTVDVHSVGAGGGSIARIDAGGALRVGPDSASADPGPACYGEGTLPTVTDAHVVLGRLRPDRFLGGRMELSLKAARRSLRPIAKAFHDDVEEAASSVVRVADASMERALRVISVERGHDPRRFTLVAFGGAGPLHACQLAQSLGVQRVLIPPFPGVLSAFGMAAAPVTTDRAQALLAFAEPSAAFDRTLSKVFATMEAQVRRELAAQGYKRGVSIGRSLDMRYAGQSYEITVPVTSADASRSIAAFHAAHKRRYGHSDPSRPVEVVSVRMRGQAPGAAVRLPAIPRGNGSTQAAGIERVPVWFDRERKTWLYERSELRSGDRLRGPALVLQLDSTTVVPPGWQGRVDRLGSLILEANG